MLAQLEQLAERSQPVINMSFAACDDILRSGKYRNYDQRIESAERDPAGPTEHGDRELVGQRLYPNYGQHIQYAALSPDGNGLANSYGPVAVRWGVTREYLGRRASLMEENSYSFYAKHSLGALRSTVPSGYQCAWEDRGKLAVAKLATTLTPATAASELPALLLRSGVNRSQDEFIEIAIYADEGLDGQDIDRVAIERAPATPEEGHRRDIIREVCVGRAMSFVE
jgi:hypothetical protein